MFLYYVVVKVVSEFLSSIRLPYLEAVIHETHRIVSLAPMSMAHAVTEDTQLEGYTLPKVSPALITVYKKGAIIHPQWE